MRSKEVEVKSRNDKSNSRFLLSSNLKLLPKYFIVILIMDANRS